MERCLCTNGRLEQNSGKFIEMGGKAVFLGQRKRNIRNGEEAVEKGRTQKEGTGNREKKGRYCNKRKMNLRGLEKTGAFASDLRFSALCLSSYISNFQLNYRRQKC